MTPSQYLLAGSVMRIALVLACVMIGVAFGMDIGNKWSPEKRNKVTWLLIIIARMFVIFAVVLGLFFLPPSVYIVAS